MRAGDEDDADAGGDVGGQLLPEGLEGGGCDLRGGDGNREENGAGAHGEVAQEARVGRARDEDAVGNVAQGGGEEVEGGTRAGGGQEGGGRGGQGRGEKVA